jgi:hypothetical protein
LQNSIRGHGGDVSLSKSKNYRHSNPRPKKTPRSEDAIDRSAERDRHPRRDHGRAQPPPPPIPAPHVLQLAMSSRPLPMALDQYDLRAPDNTSRIPAAADAARQADRTSDDPVLVNTPSTRI